MKLRYVVGIVILLSACATGTQTYTLQNKFNPNAVSWIRNQGTSSIVGQAFIQTQGGQPRTCAGKEVVLWPVTAYSRERALALYDSEDKGYNSAFTGKKITFIGDDPQFTQYVLKSICDADGNFEFNEIPAGSYYVGASIVWSVEAFILEGGNLMQKVAVKDGQKKKILLTP